MFSLEDKLRPPFLARAWPRDVLGIALLVALAAAMLPPALIYQVKPTDPAGAVAYRFASAEEFQNAVTEPMVSIYLLPALGLLLALRQGALDLSVWISACLGGVISAGLINAGWTPAAAMLTGVGAGALVGAANGLLVAGARVPSALATIAVALVVMWTIQSLTPARSIPVADNAFDNWHLTTRVRVLTSDSGQDEPDRHGSPLKSKKGLVLEETAMPLVITRMLLVAGVYALAMLVLLALQNMFRRGMHVSRRWSIFAALCASGALSAAGGVLWVLDHGSAPVLSRPVEDLRIVSAAILAGAVFFGGRGRSLLAGLCLPGAMLLATFWRQRVWNYQFEGYCVQLLLLTGMVLVAHAAMAQVLAGRYVRKPLAIPSALCAAAGVVALAFAANLTGHAGRTRLYALALAIWLVGAVLLIASRILAERVKTRLH